MRRCYLVCYDIRNQKCWRQIFKIMNGHGEHWQFSVFFCVLKEIDRVRMQTQLGGGDESEGRSIGDHRSWAERRCGQGIRDSAGAEPAGGGDGDDGDLKAPCG